MKSILIVALCAAVALALDESIVSTQYGNIKGVVYEKSRAFYNVPYASPPTGSNRWQPPVAPQKFNGTYDATIWGPACPQNCDFPPFTCPLFGYSEDCLKLYIFTPRLVNLTQPVPVGIFIHGGNFLAGGDATPLYSGLYDANNTNMIVITIQYRLGALGFFLNNEGSGNYGFLDQQFALKWVNQNIAAFGGDPTKVTIFGQSAGGASIMCHLLAPDSYPYYRGAIMESDPITVWLKTEHTMKKLSQEFAAEVNCSYNNMTCLRALTPDQIVQAQYSVKTVFLDDPISAFMPWMPYNDGKIIQGQPLQNFTTGKYNHVPFILGNVENEALLFIWQAFPEPLDELGFKAFLSIVFLTDAPKVLAEYPVPKEMKNDTRHLLSYIGTQWIWICPFRNISRYMSENNVVYRYRFDQVYSFDPWGPNFTECITKVCHGSELAYVFNSAPKAGFHWDHQEKVLAELLSTQWGNMINSLNPNTPFPTTAQWTAFTAANDLNIWFKGDKSAMQSGYEKRACDFWDTIGYGWGNGCAPGECDLKSRLNLLSPEDAELVRSQWWWKRWTNEN